MTLQEQPTGTGGSRKGQNYPVIRIWPPTILQNLYTIPS